MRLCKEAVLENGTLLPDALMIDARKRQVLWYSENGANLLKVFSCEQVPIAACLCRFGDADNAYTKQQAVAILISPVLLRLHPPTGDSFDILLPHPMSALYSIPSGLLFYREYTDNEDRIITGIGSPKNTKYNRMSFSPTSVTTKNEEKVIPIMFVLSNPLSFLSPVSICTNSSEFDAKDKLDVTSGQSALGFSYIHNPSKPSVLATPLPSSPSKLGKTFEDNIVNIYGKYVCTIAKDGSGNISLWSIETLSVESTVDMTAASLDKSVSSLGKSMTVVMDTTGYATAMNTSGVSSASANSIGSMGAISRKVKSYSPNIFNPANPQNQFSSISGFAGSATNPLDALTTLLGSGYQQKESGNMLRTGSPNIFSYNNGRSTPTLFGRSTPVGDILAQASINQSGSSPSVGAMSIDKDVTSERITYTSAVNTVISQPELDPSFCLVLRGTYSIEKSGLFPSFNKINPSDIKCVFIDKIDDSNVLLLHLHHVSGIAQTLEYNRKSQSLQLTRQNHTIYSQQASSSSTSISCVAIAHATVPIGISAPYSLPFSLLLDQLNSVTRLSYMLGTKLLYSTELEWIDDLTASVETVGAASPVSISSLHGGQNRYILLHCQESQVVLSLPSTLFGNIAYCNQDVAVMLLETVKGNQTMTIPVENILALMIYVETNAGDEHVIPCLLYSLFLDDSCELPNRFSRSIHELILSTRNVCNAEGGALIGAVMFDMLHSCWEDLVLRSSRVSAMTHLGTVLRSFLTDTFCSGSAELSAIATEYCNHYSRTLSQHTPYNPLTNYQCCGVWKPFTCCSIVPDATSWLCSAISALHNSNVAPAFPFPNIVQSICYTKSYQSLRFCYNIMQECVNEMRRSNHFNHPVNFAFTLANSYVHHSHGDILALGLLPIELKYVVEMALFQCKTMNGNQNVSVNIHGKADNIGHWPDNILAYIGRPDLCRNTSNKLRVNSNVGEKKQSAQPVTAVVQSDGLADVESAAHQLRFGEDDRVHEVCRMLRSSKHIYLRVERTPENSDLEHRSKLQMRLLTLCRRTFAACVGRGMLTMGSLEPLMAESLPIPTLMLAGRVPPQNIIIALETTHAPSELTLWPEFHNGVAAGLRVGPAERRGFKQAGFGNNVPVRVTRNWIIYNRTAYVGNEAAHAGFLLALGLQGYLNVLSVTDICDYLTQGHEPTTVALLIGMAAAKVGSADTLLSKTLCLHLPALLPPRINCDIEISPIVQTAALTGLGLLHAGSGHRLMTEFLLAEISRKPTSDCCETREAMALSVSWALGMVLLAKGSKNIELGIGTAGNIPSEGLSGLADLHIEDRLFQHIVGGKRPTESHLFPLASLLADANSKSSRILEGEDINVNVTAPGATIALAMIYIKSNNLEIARRLALPVTSFDIDAIRPDLLLFRAMSICLVMWDNVEPSEMWIENQVPECITSVLYSAPTKPVAIPYKKNNGSDNKLSPKSALGAYLCIVTGYCIGIGLVHAGTSNESAKATILAKLKVLQCLRDNKLSKAVQFQNLSLDKAMKPLIEMCVSCTAVALSYVMAGTGDLACLRIFRELRWKVEDVNYGSHMSIGMAIGMLFLAGGNASLRRDPFSISCLLLSICPRFPMRTADNQYHLQPLRHMYVLAAESRALRTVDIDSGVSVPLNVTVEMNDGTTLAMRAPCLVPELTTIKSVVILSEENKDQYYSKRFSFTRNHEDERLTSLPPLFVKRKAAISVSNSDEVLMEKAALNSFLHVICSSMQQEALKGSGIKDVLSQSPHIMSIIYKSMKEV